jgi:Ca2+-transporting ATPase
MQPDALEFDDEPLSADPGEEEAFTVENNPFAFSPGQLAKMINPKSIGAFRALGGLQGLLRGLRTDGSSGLSLDETALDGTVEFHEVITPLRSNSSYTNRGRSTSFSSTLRTDSKPYMDRNRVFGDNRLPEKRVKSIFQLMWIAFNDKVLILLTTVATISLGLGLYQTFGQPHKEGEPRVEWVEGVTIMTAVIIVVVVGALNDYQKEQQFARLNKKVGDIVYTCL